MTPRVQAALQDRIISAIKATHPGTTSTQIAAVAGVNKSQVSHWTTDDSGDAREMRLGEIVALSSFFGSSTVLGPIAALDDAEVIPSRRTATQDPGDALLDVHAPLGALAAGLLSAMRDGRCSAEERASMLPDARRLVRELQEWIDAEEARQEALPLAGRRSA
ncbi:MAG TPA: hypothetical protein VFV33_04680 [Gemmatimonadaceae bacterium]|nr:hypothetical protein [Gemmatimonadaceae bacterium]